MVAFIARKAHDPTVRFVSVSYLIHFGVLLSAFYVMSPGKNPLLNPGSMTMVMLGAGYAATAGTTIHRATGSLWTASCQIIGVPLAIVGIGIPIAIAVESTEYAPIIQSMLFAPWWTVFMAVTIWQYVRGKKAEHPWGQPVFGVVGTSLLFLAMAGVFMLLMTLLTVINLTL